MVEITLVIVLAIVWCMFPVHKSVVHTNPENASVMGGVALFAFIVYTTYTFIKSRKKK